MTFVLETLTECSSQSAESTGRIVNPDMSDFFQNVEAIQCPAAVGTQSHWSGGLLQRMTSCCSSRAYLHKSKVKMKMNGYR